MSQIPRIIQNAYVVRDLYESIGRWVELFRVGPFFILPVESSGLEYRGQPGTFKGLIALSYSGDQQIELIQQTSTSPSVYLEFMETRGEGFHHNMWQFDDFDADCDRLTRMGYKLAMRGESPGLSRVAYFDAVAELGYFIELSDAAPIHRERFARMKAICAEWDGRDPIRDFQSLLS